MLELRNIEKYYNPGTINEMCLFDKFNLTVDKGEFVSVVGSNGSGKTSMLNILCGSIPVDGGQILMNREDITTKKEFKRNQKIGRVYQNPAMGTCPTMTILENMSLADNKGKKFGLGFGTNKKRVDYYRELLSQLGLGLEDMMGSKVGSLSGGQRQAMALLMTTMAPIEILILDEHTAALDPKTAELIMELTGKVVKEKNLTTIMVTHNLRYAVEYGNRILMMHQGHAVLDKAGEEKAKLVVDDLLDQFNQISIEWLDSFFMDVMSCWCVIRRISQFHIRSITNFKESLYDSFSKCCLSNQRSGFIIFDRTRKDLCCTRTVTIN